jgi:hypothetical protein
VDGNFLAARTTFSGDFTGVFTYSPIGPARGSLDRHATCIVAAYVAGAAR